MAYIEELVKDSTYIRLRHRVACIFSRCYNSDDKSFSNYGARGIRVWQGWNNDRAAFIRHLLTLVGHNDPDLQIDRILNDGDYSPGNLRFVSPKINSNNRRNSRSDGEGTVTNCHCCEESFTRKDKGQKYCSRGCSLAFRRKEGSAGTISLCGHCSEMYRRKSKGQRFCGYTCSARGRVSYGK